MPCTGIKLRAGRRSDWRALRILLPEAVHFGSGVITWVATELESDLIVGAIAVDPALRPKPVVGAKIALHVIRPWRGRGLETDLIGAVTPAVLRLGGEALYTWGAIEVGGDAELFWRGHGFNQGERVTEGRFSVQRGLDFIEPVWTQLCARGRVPEGLAVLDLNEVDPERVARLYQTHIGGSLEKILREIRGDSGRAFHAYASPVLLLNGELVGVILGRTQQQEGIGFVEAVIVDTPYRGGWANIALRLHGWRRCVEIGVHTLTYFIHDRHSDTARFCEKLGVITRDFVEPYRILDADVPNA